MNLDSGDVNGTDSSPTLAATASYLGGTITPGPGKRLRLSSRRQSGEILASSASCGLLSGSSGSRRGKGKMFSQEKAASQIILAKCHF